MYKKDEVKIYNKAIVNESSVEVVLVQTMALKIGGTFSF